MPGRKRTLRIACDAGQTLGTLDYLPLPTGNIVLDTLWVAPNARRKGHGRRIVESFVKEIGSDQPILLYPVPESVDFWRSMGARPDEEAGGLWRLH